MFHGLSSMNICLVLLLILVLLRAMISNAEPNNPQCVASSCGDVRNISQPFRLKSDPNGCGDPKYELVCEDNRTVLYFHDNRFYVQSINYSNNHIRLVYDGLEKDNCSSLARYSWALYGFRNSFNTYFMSSYHDSSLVIVNCSKVVNSAIYIATSLCIKGLHSSNTLSNWKLYALFNPVASDVRDFCTISGWMKLDDFMVYEQIDSSSDKFELIHKIMADGSTLSFSSPSREKTIFFCYFDLYSYFHNLFYSGTLDTNSFFYSSQVCGSRYYEGGVLENIANWTTGDFRALLVLFCVAKFIIGMPFVTTFLIYKYRRRHLAMDKNIEEFLQAQNNFLPIRYSYSNIKKITKNFKHKLGEGGYGSMYKGMLRSGNEVAIKILKQSKAHGQDFINEVATIGRIHHVNVVQLIGFCFGGSKQALVYDLMTNGSLDKHIFCGGS